MIKTTLPTALLDQLYTTFSHCPGHYYIKDLQGRYLFCNLNQAHSGGYDTIDKMIGRTDHNTPWKEQANVLQFNDTKVCKHQTSMSFYETAKLHNGLLTTSISEKQPFYVNHELAGICGVSVMIPKPAVKSCFVHRMTHQPIQVSQKQQQCLELLLSGKTAKQVGAAMHISPRTVEDHLAAIRRKNHFRSNKEMIGLINVMANHV